MSKQLMIGVERPDQADVHALLVTVRSWAEDLYPPESRHGLALEAYADPDITLFIAREGGVLLGCGAYRLQGDGSAEVKSMFVLPEARGRGIGRAILAAIEDAVRGRVTTLRLETGIHQDAAIRLYESAGFRHRGPFGSYRDDPLSVFMEKPL
ncbi:MAG TPA: GNAT family N-acetyltransferase [Geminicoccaceae bacterium]|jgi:putative acetyltransferase|nr:GNAT family N-acetyltransferase [Geminicoccaceae bacterium]